MKLTTERLKEIIKEEVTAALTEGPDRKEQLRQAIETVSYTHLTLPTIYSV